MRLSDLIRQGKIPEKKKNKEEIKIRNLFSPNKENEQAIDMNLTSKNREDGLSESDLPTEAREDGLLDVSDVKATDSIPSPGEKELSTPSTDELKEQNRIEDLYTSIYNCIECIISSIKRKESFTIDKGLEIVKEIVQTEKAINILYGKAVMGDGIPDDLAAHSVNVCIYSLMLGKGVNYPHEQLIELGITALLHDLGMVLIPKEIVSKEGTLTTSELEQIRKHPNHTYEILQTLGEKYLWIAEAASQEQERDNGQGYPNGLKGDEIHDYAKIIGVVDVYEALTHHRPQRRGYMPHDAVKLILGTQKDLFSNDVKRLLLTKLSCFPLGSYIKLNSNAICKVIEVYEDSPLRPTVEILFDSQKHKLSKTKIIRLIESPLLYITGTVYKSDLPQ